jgi:hypothetical protein
MAVANEVSHKLAASENRDHFCRFLEAVRGYEEGLAAFRGGNAADAISKHEEAMERLAPVPEAKPILAVIQGAMVSEYATAGDLRRALRSGQEAEGALGSDARLRSAYAGCLHDLGNVLLLTGSVREGVKRRWLRSAWRTSGVAATCSRLARREKAEGGYTGCSVEADDQVGRGQPVKAGRTLVGPRDWSA